MYFFCRIINLTCYNLYLWARYNAGCCATVLFTNVPVSFQTALSWWVSISYRFFAAFHFSFWQQCELFCITVCLCHFDHVLVFNSSECRSREKESLHRRWIQLNLYSLKWTGSRTLWPRMSIGSWPVEKDWMIWWANLKTCKLGWV